MPYARLAIAFLLLVAAAPARANPSLESPASKAAVEALLERMTLEEKVGQLNLASLAFPFDAQLAAVRQGRIGGMFNVVNPDHVRVFREAAKASRLGIPLLFGLDVIHAFSIAFPVPIAWAATWRPSLAEAATEAIAHDAAAAGINWTFAPMVDISRDPRWGRVIEGAGEDAFLGAAFAAARVRGYHKGGLATSAKHFVGYGAPEAGRDYNGAQISTPELFDRYLPPFQAAIAADSEFVMASFNTINGIPVTAERRLLTDLLKRRLGFEGVVVSDFAAVAELINHGVAGDLAAAGRKAMRAGIDLDMESNAYAKHLADEVRSGRLPMSAVDAAVRRVLAVKYRMGLLARGAPAPVPPKPDEAAMRRVARDVARESFVLLKNDGDRLPITAEWKSIALIGASAASSEDFSWYGPATLEKPSTETLVEAMRERLAPGQTLRYAPGFTDHCGTAFADKRAAVKAAASADLIVLVVTEDCEVSGEGVSRAYLDLSGVQQEMLEALVETGKPLVLIVETGRPLTLAYAARHADAILVVWQPGTEGRTALADILTGAAAPSGKLPMTFPRAVGQIPISYNQLPTSRPATGNRYTTGYLDEEVTPLYPFGHGLSYTTFRYSELALSAPTMAPDGSVEVRVTVENAGSREGSEVVQLYTHQLVAARSRPVRELKGFTKITLAPGEKRTVRLPLAAAALAYHDDEGRPVVEPGTFRIYMGGNSAADLSTDLTIAAEK